MGERFIARARRWRVTPATAAARLLDAACPPITPNAKKAIDRIQSVNL